MTRFFLLVLTMNLLYGCGSKDSFPGLIDRQKMQLVMWDVIQADVFTEQYVKKDSLKNPKQINADLQNRIFALHKVSREDFYKSYEYYVAHSDQMKALLDSMSALAERERTNMMRQHSGGGRPPNRATP